MSHLPRPTSAASTSSSSGIGTLSGGLSKIPKPGFSRESSSLTKDDLTSSKIPKIPKPGFSRENSTLKSATSDDFKVGDKVMSRKMFENRQKSLIFTTFFFLQFQIGLRD